MKIHINYTGKLHIHFNRHGAAPLIWSISPEGRAWEIEVQKVDFHVPLHSQFHEKATADEDDGLPSAWFEAYGRLEVSENGEARVLPC